MDKPSYSTTKRSIWINTIAAWAVIFLLIVGGALLGIEQAVSLASIVVPSMVALITGQMALHRHYGSKDFAAAAQEHPPQPDPSNRPRDQPDEAQA